jgi:hypothetical protein
LRVCLVSSSEELLLFSETAGLFRLPRIWDFDAGVAGCLLDLEDETVVVFVFLMVADSVAAFFLPIVNADRRAEAKM